MIDDTVRPHQRHPLTPVLLGMLANVDDFKALVEASTIAEEDALAPDNPLVLVALGVLSADRTLRRWLRHETREPTPAVRARIDANLPSDMLR